MPENLRSRAIVVGAALTLLVGLFSVDYTVERGDTLGKIARDHDVSVADLVDAREGGGGRGPHEILNGALLAIWP